MKLNKHLPMLIICALMAALSMVFKRFAIFNIDWLRFSLENTPILLSGVLFGPIAGFVTGIVGDILGCFYCGFTVNPIITFGAGVVGGMAGLGKLLTKKLPILPGTAISVYLAHIIGNMIVKSIGIWLWYGTPLASLALRIPTYLIIGAVEIVVIYTLLKSKAFVGQLRRIKSDR